MIEYVRADDIQDIIRDIEPSPSDYYGVGIGVTEQAILDRQREIADMLKGLEIVDIEEED